ncbi:PucR family transcriptional regulator [Marivita sp. S6314]|uniref:PucR family transcriptional regulator n=1 Tax=Marivita sp. S6314 TaxID=2926406 RepID=UPI001FF6B9E7|nr:PucR family transcriptional regulator [Marivita sp. S6314]MCK0150936.1 PucR family transcriptional regulator [Marivita sp. S6314]
MTTIITRYFEDAGQAEAVKSELVYGQRFSPAIVSTYTKADGLTATLMAEHVAEDTAKAYADNMKKGGSVLLVRAGYKPLGVAKITRETATRMGAVDMGGLNETVFFKDTRKRSLKVLTEHPYMLSRPPGKKGDRHHMADWPIPLISRRKPYNESAIPRHGRMANFPIPLISRRKPNTASIFPRHARMAAFPIPLISRRKPFTGSIIPRHARMANFPLPLISRRKPYDKFAFPRHMRMANWPFPHLIDGEEHTNALIPGGPRMANFPIPLLSDRKPFDKSAFPRHMRMANFPISLISRRKPFTGSIISRHGRMADMLLPLTIRHAGTKTGSDAKGFSFSKMLGLETIKRR